MTDELPLVSILTPSFGQGRFLGDCLDSVARQAYPRIEHVVMDGGSTDGSREVLAHAGDKVRWTSEPDRGQADAVNKAFEASSGEIVGWVNSDDGLFAVDTIERVVAALAHHPEAGVVYGDAALVDETGRIVRHHRSRWPEGALPLASPLAQPAAFFRRSVIEPGEPLLRVDLHRFLDYELWLRLRRRGVTFVHLPVVLAVDRDHPERKVRTTDEIFARESAQLVEEYGPVFAVPRLRRAKGLLRRMRGVPEVWRWESHEPAFPWSVDERLARIVRQVAKLDPVQLTPEQLRFGREVADVKRRSS
ncbi:MAG TPA: glycosyltransferase family 2 protein [Gaiellaceae bacterium]|nr:glycosyltransferase family 2 protein [Gaiellaceae bacterium]